GGAAPRPLPRRAAPAGLLRGGDRPAPARPGLTAGAATAPPTPPPARRRRRGRGPPCRCTRAAPGRTPRTAAPPPAPPRAAPAAPSARGGWGGWGRRAPGRPAPAPRPGAAARC